MEQPAAAVADLKEAQPKGEPFTDHPTSLESSSPRAGSWKEPKKILLGLAEYLSLVPGIHMVAPNHLDRTLVAGM